MSKKQDTQHAFLVAWGWFAEIIGLIQALQDVPLHQKKYTHTPQTKVLEFLVAIVGGTEHLQGISLAAHPLDVDQAVAGAWRQSGWADYSGVSRTLSSLSWDEARTGLRPRRRTDLLRPRIETFERQTETTQQRLLVQRESVQKARDRLAEARQQVLDRQAILTDVEESYRVRQREELPTSRLALARKRLKAAERRCWSRERALQSAEGRLAKTQTQRDEQQDELRRLQERLVHFERDNETNLAPVEAEFRLDAGFCTYENVALLIEMGYEVYTKAHNHQVVTFIKAKTGPETLWTRVGANAEITACERLLFKHCPYPLDVGLERFYTGRKLKHSAVLHFGSDPVTETLSKWFKHSVLTRLRFTYHRCVAAARLGHDVSLEARSDQVIIVVLGIDAGDDICSPHLAAGHVDPCALFHIYQCVSLLIGQFDEPAVGRFLDPTHLPLNADKPTFGTLADGVKRKVDGPWCLRGIVIRHRDVAGEEYHEFTFAVVGPQFTGCRDLIPNRHIGQSGAPRVNLYASTVILDIELFPVFASVESTGIHRGPAPDSDLGAIRIPSYCANRVPAPNGSQHRTANGSHGPLDRPRAVACVGDDRPRSSCGSHDEAQIEALVSR
jgi:hypothetical protein